MTTESKKDVFSIVTENVLKVMASGIVPWRMPWGIGGIPRNAITQKPYRGVNVPLLAMHSFESNVFISEKQLQNLQGKAKEGEYPMIATYWEWRTDREDSEKQYSALLYERVFNVSQCEGISLEGLAPPSIPENPLKFCHDLVKGIEGNAPTISYGAEQMRYNMEEDTIYMPASDDYNNPELFYSDLFDMLIHATGTPSRLRREEIELFGEGFTKEDLITDIGSHWLCYQAGISNNLSVMSVGHLHKWMELFKEDPKLFVSACTQAQKAVDFILNGYVLPSEDNNFYGSGGDENG